MTVRFQDYYQTLGVERTATPQQIKAAYRKLARKWHPDLHSAGDKEAAEERFKRINEAYEALKEPDKRARYDRLGDRWQDGEDFSTAPDMEGVRFYRAGPAAGDTGFSDFFDMLFGQRTARQARPYSRTIRGEDVESELSLTLEEAFVGTTRELRIAGRSICSECGGTAVQAGSLCAGCGGTGSVAEERTLQVKVPAGVEEGSRIRLKGQGGAGLGGGPRGDLYLKVRFLPHPVFRLAGRDIESDMWLRPEQAVLGDRVTARTLDGQVTVTVPPNSRAGSKLRLRGKGYRDGQDHRGDHLVRVSVDIPRDIGDDEQELYRQLRELHRNRG